MKVKLLIHICLSILALLLPTREAICNENRVVLVVGGAGYIGSHTCKTLKEAGFIPVTYDSLELGSKEAVKWGPLVIGNLLDREKLEKTFLEYQPQAVIHLAALLSVGESVYNPSGYYTNNIVGSINLLNTMLKYNVKTIVFSSSCTVYGICEKHLIDEQTPVAPINPYAMSKYVVETIIQDYASAYEFKYMILRYFNAAGVDLESGLTRSSYNFLIPQVIRAVLHPELPLQVFGTDYLTPDGTAIRDYIHVKDLAQAHLLSLRYLQAGKPNEIINLGTGKGYSILEIIDAIEKITGKKVPYVSMPKRKGDVPEAVANTKKSKEILDFEPQFSNLFSILQSEWISLSFSAEKPGHSSEGDLQ